MHGQYAWRIVSYSVHSVVAVCCVLKKVIQEVKKTHESKECRKHVSRKGSPCDDWHTMNACASDSDNECYEAGDVSLQAGENEVVVRTSNITEYALVKTDKESTQSTHKIHLPLVMR